MAGFIELIAKIKPKNNGKYALVDDVDVEMEDGSRLSEAIKKPRIPDGGTKGQILAKKSDTNGDAEWVEPLKTEDIDKKLESKLDKNLGSENSDKVLTTDAKGNIITQNKEDFEGGGGTTDYNNLENKPQINGVELKGNKTSSDLKMYTQEEVDDLLYDKMDKPYKPITITDDITIEDCLDGRFKINKILGNTYQAEESDIIPTPQRPIPINSRKTTITKINPNVFDLEKESDTSNIPDSGTYRSIGQYQLKSNTKYVFSWSEATVPAKATLSLQIQDEKETVLVSPFTYFNLEATEKKETGKKVEFTTNESGIVKFAYNCTVATSNTTEMYQRYWYTKILKDITLKENVEYEPEYVELRSLKETSNLFDKNIMAFTSGSINANGVVGNNISYTVSGFVPVEPSTQYTIKLIDGFRSSTKVYFDINKQAISNDGTTTFTTPSNCYFIRWQTATTDTRVLTEEDIQKINDEMMMVKGDSLPSTYVPPTVRDYKIVDHTTQTSKIVRNVNQFELPTDFSWNDTDYYPNIIGNVIPEDKKGVFDTGTYNLINYTTEPYFGYSNTSGLYLGFSECDTYWELNNSDEVNAFLTRIKEDGKPFLFQYQLATPVEEQITYLENDVSEVGYSWQDTTSPSPTIPAEIKGVDKIDITVTGKNLFDFSKIKEIDNLTIDYENKTITITANTNNVGYVNNLKDLMGGYKIGEKYVMSAKTSNPEAQRIIYFLDIKNSIRFDEPFTLTEEMLNSPFAWYNNIESKNQNVISNIQIEQSDTATAYEPYTEQRVNITLPQPLYQNDVANVESGDYEYEAQKYIVTGDEEFYQDYQNQAGYYGRYFNLKNGNGVLTEKIWCNYLSYILSSWGSASEGCCQNSRTQIHLKFSNDRLGITDNTPLEEKRLVFANYLKRLYASGDSLYVVVKVAKTTQPIPEEDLAKLKSLKTEQGINNIFVGSEVKPTIEARYALDIASIVSKLQTKLLTLQEEVVKNV